MSRLKWLAVAASLFICLACMAFVRKLCLRRKNKKIVGFEVAEPVAREL
jgi:hypothetical protein